MTNTLQLETEIRRAKLSKKEVAQQLGISVQAFLMKLNNQTEFKASEIEKLCEILNLPDKSIFFANEREL